MTPIEALEERRKKTTLRKVPRIHAGKITQPYKILEALIKEVDQFNQLENSKIIVVWKSGWKPTKDDILKHAQIRKLSELEREIWGDEYDLCMLLHRELWQSSKFTETHREQDIFHELLHVVAEIDDKTGEQKLDDRGRRCWRLRSHPIQRFPEEIQRYGIEAILDLEESAKIATDDEASRREAEATENDESRPLLAAAEGADPKGPRNFDAMPIDVLRTHSTGKRKISERQIARLTEAGFDTVGKLIAHMRAEGEWWARSVVGIGRDTKTPIEDAIAAIQTS